MEGNEAEPADDGLLSADAIDERFIPVPKQGYASVELDGETVIAESEGGRVHCVDAIGTIVWSCFDGVASIDELSHELSDAFGVDSEIVRNDVLVFARELGRVGLLEGVAAETPAHIHDAWAEPESLPLGTVFEPFEFLALDGNLVSLASLRGRSALLVNWSPQCGFCRTIVPELAGAHTALREKNVELVLMATGTAEDNLALLQEHGLDCMLLLQESAVVGEFVGLGTPVAYLLDGEAKVSSDLAVGANRVPDLVRQTAGLNDEVQA